MSADHKANAAWNDYVSQQQDDKIEELNSKIRELQTTIRELEEVNEYLRDKIDKLEYKRLDNK